MLEIMIVTHGKLSEGQRKINYDQHSRTHASIC